MRGMEAAEEVLMQVFKEHAEQGNQGLFASELISEALEIPVEPSRMHNASNFIRKLIGKDTTDYNPLRPPGRVSILLHRLEAGGILESERSDTSVRTLSNGKVDKIPRYRLIETDTDDI